MMALSQASLQDMYMSDMQQQQQQQQQQQLQQQQQHYPIYRPVYHPRTATPAAIAPRQSNEMRAAAGPEQEAQVIVPSMSALMSPAGPFLGYYPAPFYPFQSYPVPRQGQLVSSPLFQPAAVAMHTPIHHTLENATITYDTVVQHNLQKDLVKDVFFSPAMITPQRTRDLEGVASETSVCGSLQSDNESDTSSTGRALMDDEADAAADADGFSPHVTPSDLLPCDDPLFFIGLDFVQEESGETKKKPLLSLHPLDAKANAFFQHPTKVDLPTPPANTDDSHGRLGSLKRRRVEETNGHKRPKHAMSDATPPTSPGRPVGLFEDHLDYFDDASAEESSDEDDTEHHEGEANGSQGTMCVRPLPGSIHPYGFDPLDFTSISQSDDDDNESTTSWEPLEALDETDSEDESEVTQRPRRQPVTLDVNETGYQKLKEEQEPVDEEQDDHEESGEDEEAHAEKVPARPTAYPTIYQKLTKANVDWCRYCGTTEGVNWRPGPWGKRTLCNKHGCDYKGYGFACKLPRLDLTGFTHETIDDRDRPVLQLFCATCHKQESWAGNVLVRCEGCPKALHQKCGQLTDEFVASQEAWFCDASCRENARRKRIVVELPRKRLPLMCAPKNNAPAVSSEGTRTRSARESR